MKTKLLITGYLLLLAVSIETEAQVSYNDTMNYRPTGKLFDIGGYRMHINSTGKGRFTIIFINGAFGFSFDWTSIQGELSKEARTCSYDRPGLAWSDIGPMPHTIAQNAYELHKLLKAAKIKPPYILVGQSVGGLIARKYAKEYPLEINGMVLIDATSENGLFGVGGKIERLRMLASDQKKIPKLKDEVDSLSKRIAGGKIKEFSKVIRTFNPKHTLDKLQDSLQNLRFWAGTLPKYSTAEGEEFWAEEFAEIYTNSLSYKLVDKPLIVLCSIKNEYPEGWDMRDSMMTEKLNNQKRFLNLSTNSKLITTEISGHEIHLQEPELVINAIKQVMHAITNKSSLE